MYPFPQTRPLLQPFFSGLPAILNIDPLLESESGDCTSVVDLVDGDTDNSSWFEMWAAAVAVDEICVKHGKAGAAFGLGKSMCSFGAEERILMC